MWPVSLRPLKGISLHGNTICNAPVSRQPIIAVSNKAMGCSKTPVNENMRLALKNGFIAHFLCRLFPGGDLYSDVFNF